MQGLVIKRQIIAAANRERVWRAITTPEQLAKWFEPIRFERLAVGEPLKFEWGGAGEIALVQPMDRFGFRWQIAAPHPAMTMVIFELETVPGGTRVTVTEHGFEGLPEEVREEHRKNNIQGWEEMLDKLNAYCQEGSHD